MPSHLLVASLGNPAPYTNTFHSAGHVLLDSIHILLAYPPFAKDSQFGGPVSRGEQFTLFQSPSYMNTSGKSVLRAYKSFLGSLPASERAGARLVVLHDELESPLGKIRMKVGGSAKGHNGLKDCARAFGGAEFTKIGVGIGRPVSRESDAVASFVLRKMKPEEAEKVRGGAAEALALLQRISESG